MTTEITALTSVFSGTHCAGFMLRTARGWRAFTSHVDCASRLRPRQGGLMGLRTFSFA